MQAYVWQNRLRQAGHETPVDPIGLEHALKILQTLYFYAPYTSGLTIYCERLSRELVRRGHEVTVLTSWHDRSLPRENVTEEGVHVVRIPIAANLSRAVILPTLLPTAARLLRSHDVLHLHLPMAEATPLTALGRTMRKRVVITHHSDLVLSSTLVEKIATGAGRASGIGAAHLAQDVVASTRDQAAISPTVRGIHHGLHIIPPPVPTPVASADGPAALRARFDLGDGPVIGFVGRFTVEKGLDVFMRAVPAIRAALPTAVFALAGPNIDPRTGEPYRGPWDEDMAQNREAIRILGRLSDQELADFFATMDVLVLPSVDNTETFGMVQVEAMLSGTPSVCTDLPGVREPVRRTGMGRIAAVGDANSLAEAVIEVARNRDAYVKPFQAIASQFSLDATIDAYERVYRGEEDATRPLSGYARKST
ncbi:MAG: glycosyltransferase family 4 protein [Thermomicrobiales bacterium]